MSKRCNRSIASMPAIDIFRSSGKYCWNKNAESLLRYFCHCYQTAVNAELYKLVEDIAETVMVLSDPTTMGSYSLIELAFNGLIRKQKEYMALLIKLLAFWRWCVQSCYLWLWLSYCARAASACCWLIFIAIAGTELKGDALCYPAISGNGNWTVDIRAQRYLEHLLASRLCVLVTHEPLIAHDAKFIAKVYP